MLVLHGAWILMRDKKNLLFAALENGDIYMVDFLVTSFKEFIDYADELGNFPLIVCQTFPIEKMITTILLSHNAKVDHSRIHSGGHGKGKLSRFGLHVLGAVQIHYYTSRGGRGSLVGVRKA